MNKETLSDKAENRIVNGRSYREVYVKEFIKELKDFLDSMSNDEHKFWDETIKKEIDRLAGYKLLEEKEK
jgi:hypothetical protein